MPKAILFDDCRGCPVGKPFGLYKDRKGSVLCPEVSKYKGRMMWRYIDDGQKTENCPYPEGIVVRKCEECPYVYENYEEFRCPKIMARVLIVVDRNKIHEDCPLDGIDCDNKRR